MISTKKHTIIHTSAEIYQTQTKKQVKNQHRSHENLMGAEVLSISNTFLYPYPRIAAFDTNGTLSVEVFPRNSGRIWARIVTWMTLGQR